MKDKLKDVSAEINRKVFYKEMAGTVVDAWYDCRDQGNPQLMLKAKLIDNGAVVVDFANEFQNRAK